MYMLHAPPIFLDLVIIIFLSVSTVWRSYRSSLLVWDLRLPSGLEDRLF